MAGKAYEYEAFVFLRRDSVPVPGGFAGHVGWGFMAEDGSYYGGGTENNSGLPVVVAPDDNGAWIERFESLHDLMMAMLGLNYGEAMATRHRQSCDSEAAIAQGSANIDLGYDVVANNCLNHTILVLQAYGVGIGLPSNSENPYPGVWYDQLQGDWWQPEPIG